MLCDLGMVRCQKTACWGRVVVAVIVLFFGGLSIRHAVAQTGEPKTKGPPRSPEEFLERERAKIREKAAREGARFDASREIQKVSERFQKDFGEPLPEPWQTDLGTAAQEVFSPPALLATPSPTRRPTTSGANTMSRGPRYVEGLPAWFCERDTNRDGQVGLYEWPRPELTQFREWDLNQDGFVAQTEGLRRQRQLSAAVPQDRAKSMTSASRPAAAPATTRSGSIVGAPPALSVSPANTTPAPKAPLTSSEFLAREMPKLLEKALREGDRLDVGRELQKLRDKHRKDVGEELPADVEAEIRNAIR